jgi:OOP family OmpA-OmpF porin
VGRELQLTIHRATARKPPDEHLHDILYAYEFNPCNEESAMTKGVRLIVIALLFGSFTLTQAAIEPPGDASKEIPSTAMEQINSLQKIEELQRRGDKLEYSKLGANDYRLAKAHTWLDLALGEYYENEGDGIVSAAIDQAAALLDSLENGDTDIGMDTPQQVLGSEAVRPDLWDKIAALKNHPNFSCGQRSVAEAEIHLVWAGHEKFESSWADAKSYARTAEELIREAQSAINDCAGPVPIVEQTTILATAALFDFAKTKINSSSQSSLDSLMDRIKSVNTLEEIDLVGHADHLRADGHPERNQLLSEQRAESVKLYLITKGVPAERVHTRGVGSSQPIVDCSTKLSMKQQVECLQPNRRVEIVLRGTRQ